MFSFLLRSKSTAMESLSRGLHPIPAGKQTALYTDHYLGELEKSVRSAMPRWRISQNAEITLHSISENATWFIRDNSPDIRYVVRVYRPGYHEDEEIFSELLWIEALRRNCEVITPRPVPCFDTASLFVKIPCEGSEVRMAAFDYMSGNTPDMSGDLTASFEQLGSISARLHLHARNWQRPLGFRRKNWTFDTIIGDNAYWGNWRDAIGLDDEGRTILEKAYQLLHTETTQYGLSSERFGLIHCDMRLANLLSVDHRIAIIDFDDCGFSWYGYDFAAAVSFMEHHSAIEKLMESWVAGYRKVSSFSCEDVAALPMFVMLRRMQLTAWIATHFETPAAREHGAAFTQGTVRLARAYMQKGGVRF